MIFGHKLLKAPYRKLKRSPKKGHKEQCDFQMERFSSRNKLLPQKTNNRKKQIIERIKMIKEYIIDKQKNYRKQDM